MRALNSHRAPFSREPWLIRVCRRVLLLTAALVPLSLLTGQVGHAQSVSVRVSSSSDDAEQDASSGSMYLNSTDLELVDDGGDQYIGLRFQSISIPAGANITSATVQFHVDETESSTAIEVTISGEDIDDASTFSSSNNDISSRTETSATVDWSIPHWQSVNDEGSDQQTPDLSAIIQEIVDRGGWSSGNDIVLIIKKSSGSGKRTAEAYDGESGSAPLLEVSYTTPGGGSVSSSVSQSSDDAEQAVSGGSMDLNSSDLELMTDGGEQYVGMRFQSIAIPQGASISSATVQFHVDETEANTAIEVTIRAEDVDDASTFTSSNNNIGSRTETTASVSWSIPHWQSVSDEGADQQTPDLSSVIQEVVDRSGWNSGNDIVLIFKSASGSGIRTAEAYDGESSNAPRLDISYLTPPGAPTITPPTTPTTDITPTISGTGTEDGGTITLTSSLQGTLSPTTTVSSGTWSITTGVLMGGTHTITAVHANASGDSPTSSGVTLEVDTSDLSYRSAATGNWSAAATWEVNDNSTWISAVEAPDFGDGVITVQSGHTVTVDVSTTSDETYVASGGTLSLQAALRLTDADTPGLDVSGTVVNASTFAVAGSPTITIQSGGVWQHAQDGGNLPPVANTTWASGSTLLVTGVTGTLPGNFTDSYAHLTWNVTSQSASLDLNGSPAAVSGNLTVQSTGSGTLQWGSADDLTLGGNLAVTGGTFLFSDAAGTLTAADVSITGGTVRLTDGAALPTFNVTGDFVLNGGTLEEIGSSTASVKFNGSSAQDITAASGFNGEIDLYVENTGGIVLHAGLAGIRHLTSTSGALDFNNNDVSLAGSLTAGTAISNAATLTMTGSSVATLTYSPGTLTIPTLAVDKSGSTLALATDLTASSTVAVRAGTLNVNGNTLQLSHGATLYNGGTVSGTITMQRTYSQASDGWRMIASPLSGVNYSDLNAAFHTQGASWADFSQGSATLQAPDFSNQDWTELSGSDAAFSEAGGYILYMFNEVNSTTLLPATWSVTGTLWGASSVSLPWNTQETDSYSFIGNPTPSKLDWHAVVAASTNLAATYATWDPSLTTGGGLTGYKFYNSTSQVGAASRYISPFTAMMVRPTATGGSIAFPTSEAANLGTSDYFGKGGKPAAYVQLWIEGEGVADSETYLTFAEGAKQGADSGDTPRPAPLAPDYVTLASLESDRSLAFDHRDMSGGMATYDIALLASRPGRYRLSWPALADIPEDWHLRLQDLKDFRTLDLRIADGVWVVLTDDEVVPSPDFEDYKPSARFRLVVVDPALATMPDPEVASNEMILAQNYPNPFNPRTSIRFFLPEADHVQVEVFDLLGRRLQTLVDGTREAGWHDVRWTAGGLPSGHYFYRIHAGQTVLTRTMILAR
ncbi:MAG: T9SS type A sorting domain-containing protein [Rhodothermales bacterium]|nr:T9SS type A sorting domain-containing protein [Rhodothermales bacterium]